MNDPGRRPGRGVLAALLDDAGLPASWPEEDSEVRIGQKYKIRKSNPTFTNFSIEVLSQFLEDQLQNKNATEAELKSNPHLVAAEADKEQLRKFVNSSRPLKLNVQNGRLTVTAAYRSARRSSSASASEGDNESRRRRSDVVHEARSSKRADQNATQRGRRRTMSNCEPRSDSLLIDFDPAAGTETSVIVHDRTYLQETGSSNIAGTVAKDTSKSDLVFVDPAWNRILGKIKEQEDIDDSESTPIARSSSFQRHTDEVRNTIRGEKRTSQTIVSKTNESASTGEDDARPRKVAGSKSFSGTRPDAQVLESTNLATTSGAPSHPLSEVNLTALQQLIHSGRRITEAAAPTQVNSNELSVPMGTLPIMNPSSSATRRNSIANRTGDMTQLGRMPQSSALVANNRSRRQTDLRDRLTGIDAFFSVSSEDDSLEDRLGEDLDKETLSKECGQSGDPIACDTDNDAKRPLSSVFEGNNVVPEIIPVDIRQARKNREKVWSLHGIDQDGQPNSKMSNSWYQTQFTFEELCADKQNILGAPDKYGQFPRKWDARPPPKSLHSPPLCPPGGIRDEFPPEIFPLICPYLSSREVRRLRLVNRATAEAVLPLMIRSTVLKFDNVLFQPTDGKTWDPKSNEPAPGSLLEQHGDKINKFGIAFGFDHKGMAEAEVKAVEEKIHAWFGTYTWPKEKYPHFPELKRLEDLAESDRPLLKNAMKKLTKVAELAISVDTGHGWLNGADVSDLAVFRNNMKGEPKLFGKTFDAPDTWDEFGIREYFQWGQQNTLNAGLKMLARLREQNGSRKSDPKNDRKVIGKFRVRDYDAFTVQTEQPDFCRTSHVGGELQTLPAAAAPAQPVQAQPAVLTTVNPPNTVTNPAVAGGPNLLLQQPNNANNPVAPPNVQPFVNGGLVALPTYGPPPPTRHRNRGRRDYRSDDKRTPPIIPQWPLIFNCYNLAAEVGGAKSYIQDEVASPADFPYMPGELNETQVQWLMETMWASRAFLSAYTNSIVGNAAVFKNVHSLHVTKLSSGLIPSLAQTDFWAALPSLKNLTLMVSPDWRQEHVLGDKFFYRNMAVSPVQASVKLAELLRDYIAKIENLSVLRTGFVGGGEHQIGLFGRNQHVLPAPITIAPHLWVTDLTNEADSRIMFAFNHVQVLTFENCWFSPRMLEGFMVKSRDTSLHHLKLDSVSLTGVHEGGIAEPLSTEHNVLRCKNSPGEWLLEEIPRSACWVNVLEKITPGSTILDHKYDAHLINEDINPRPARSFRGNVREITLDSCGYVKISGARMDDFCQNGVVEQSKPWCAVDEGLEVRKRSFYVSGSHQAPHPLHPVTERVRPPQTRFDLSSRCDFQKPETRKCVMLTKKDPVSGTDYFGLGRLTQCVHPIEKRILERAWGMRFGWGDNLERWAAVEDGCYEGGTGRFSGTIRRGDN